MNRLKSALVIGPDFYSYDRAIAKELTNSGYKVEYIPDNIGIQALSYKLCKKIKEVVNNRHQKRINCLLKTKHYDLVLVIVGRNLGNEVLKSLKNQDNTILYLWDDIGRINNYEELRKSFSYIATFDLKDSKNYGIPLIPLFYGEAYVNQYLNRDIDIYCSMGAHSDRIKIAELISESTRNCKFIINIGKVDYYIRHKRSNDSSIIYTGKGISQDNNIKYMNMSKCILDIQNPSQSGLTIRTIEALACENKIITTNKSIEEYDFYNPNNIFVIDRESPYVPYEFINSEYTKIDKRIIESYSIKSFVESIINRNPVKHIRDN